MDESLYVVIATKTQQILAVYYDYRQYEHEMKDCDGAADLMDINDLDEDTEWEMKEVKFRLTLFEGKPVVYMPTKPELYS